MDIKGLRHSSIRWQAMRNVLMACKAAGVCIPSEVCSYFDGVMDPPKEEAGMDMNDMVIEFGPGEYELPTDRIPNDVQSIRIYVSESDD